MQYTAAAAAEESPSRSDTKTKTENRLVRPSREAGRVSGAGRVSEGQGECQGPDQVLAVV
jgi:hypothetical protein